MTFAQLQSRINNNVSRIVKNTAMEFNADIISAWPVAPVNSQNSKGKWTIKDVNNFRWDVANSAGYSGILFQGRIGNRGSYQLEAGGYPILEQHRRTMINKLKRGAI